jgi:3-polyprenyl-4-hydroxybenzoate decarboxylase
MMKAEKPESGRTMSFLDQRQWMASLAEHGELHRITAEVDWDREISPAATPNTSQK